MVTVPTPGSRMGRSLTSRQREVLELRVLGLSWPAIAKKMRLAPTTVRQHYAYAIEKSRRRLEPPKEGLAGRAENQKGKV